MAKKACSEARKLPSGNTLYSVVDEELDEEYHIAVGELAIANDPHLVYVALIFKDAGIRVIVLSGTEARKTAPAGNVSRKVSAALGGSGGGDARFGQGGGKCRDKIASAMEEAEKAAGG
jgi:alanyl-tRNA synthetase